MFSSLAKTTLARAALLHDAPVYVQFYITARCNLTCQQCNIIYANSDVRECTLDEIKRIADNFARMRVAMVLLTGGEPFTRLDLPDIIREFTSRGVHVRMQTNGLATDERIQAVIAAGGRDISISLDSLWPGNQDDINGGFAKSWHDALRAMASFTRYLPKTGSFASLGCVMQRDNLGDIEDVIRFGTAIGWVTSLVPVHVTTFDRPLSFRTFDQTKRWQPAELPAVDALVERVRAMRHAGYLLYDSDQYLDDMKRFAAGQPTTWRRKNDGVCDSPNLYFAVLPNGDFAPCCDHRLGSQIHCYDADFPEVYRSRVFRAEVRTVTGACPGCLFGSYPEMTIAMRYLAAKWERVKLFLAAPPEKKWPVTYEQMLAMAGRIRTEPRERISLPGHRRRLALDERSDPAIAPTA
ncbi:MAG: radical SAM protein [Verrucomicrobia bacterium]|nr:radical SAM protein [Verrucomicrobiota bacterium]